MPAEAASRLDSCLNWPVMAVPVVNVSPETKWVFGAAVQGYFKCPNQQKTSIVQLDGAYSLSKQWYLNTSGVLYMGKRSSWILTYSLGYRDYPDKYYLRGNTFERKPDTAYTSRRFRLMAQPMYVFSPHWAIGLNTHYQYETAKGTFTSSSLATLNYLGIGLALQYDSRDVTFYPSSGLFLKVTASDYETLNSHYSRFGMIKTDFRHFLPIYKGLLFAYQLRTEWALGKDIPFQILPTLGGQDLVRGVRANMFRDNALLALQAELRVPIYTILSGTVFAGVGDVYNTRHWQWATPKVGYGLGLRLTINPAKINIRVDIARNNLDNRWNTWDAYSLYLTATEAF